MPCTVSLPRLDRKLWGEGLFSLAGPDETSYADFTMTGTTLNSYLTTLTLDIGRRVESSTVTNARDTISAGRYDNEAFRVTLSDTAQARIDGEGGAFAASFHGADVYGNV